MSKGKGKEEVESSNPTSNSVNLWDGLNELKKLIQFQSDSSQNIPSSSSDAQHFHPFSKLQPNLSIHQDSDSDSDSSQLTVTCLRNKVQESICQLNDSISTFKSKHESNRAEGNSNLTSLLKQSSSHFTLISNTLDLLNCLIDNKHPILFLPDTLNIGYLSHNHNHSKHPFTPNQILIFFDSFSSTLTQIASRYKLESFTDHFVQLGDPRLQSETQSSDGGDQGESVSKPLSIQTTTLGGRILVIDLDFSFEIKRILSNHKEQEDQEGENEGEIGEFNYIPNCKLRISYASDSSNSNGNTSSVTSNDKEKKLSSLLQSQVVSLLNLVFHGRQDRPNEENVTRKGSIENEDDDDFRYRYEAPKRAIELLESFRECLEFLAGLDRLGGLNLIASENGNTNASSSSHGIDLFNKMDSFCSQVQVISDTEKADMEKDEMRMEIDGERKEEMKESLELRSLLSKHGIPLINDPNPYLTLIYHLPFNYRDSQLSIDSLRSLMNKCPDLESSNESISTQVHFIRVGIDLIKVNNSQSQSKDSDFNQASFKSSIESDKLKLNPLPFVSSSNSHSGSSNENIKLSYVIQLFPPTLCSRLTCREIEKVTGRESEIGSKRRMGDSSFLPKTFDNQKNIPKKNKMSHKNPLLKLFGLDSMTLDQDQSLESSKNGVKFNLNLMNGNQSQESLVLDDQLLEISKIPFDDLDQFYRILEILKYHSKVIDLIRETYVEEGTNSNLINDISVGNQKGNGARKRKRLEEDQEEIGNGQESKGKEDLDLDDLLKDDEEDDEIRGVEVEKFKLNSRNKNPLPVNLSIQYPKVVEVQDLESDQDKKKKIYVPMSIEFGFPMNLRDESFTLNGNLKPDDSDIGWSLDVKLNRIQISWDQVNSEHDLLEFTNEELKKCLEFMSRVDGDDEVIDQAQSSSSNSFARLMRLSLFLENLCKFKIQKSPRNPIPKPTISTNAEVTIEDQVIEEEQEDDGDVEMKEIPKTNSSKGRRKSNSSSTAAAKGKLNRRRSSGGASGSGSGSGTIASNANASAGVSSRTRSRSGSVASGGGRSRSTSPVKERKR